MALGAEAEYLRADVSTEGLSARMDHDPCAATTARAAAAELLDAAPKTERA